MQRGTARDALRYQAVGLGRAGLPRVGSFRQHQTVPLCLCPWHYSWCGLHYVWRTVAYSTHSPTGIYDVVPSDRVAVLKAAVEFATSKVGQALGPRRLNTVTVAPVTRVVNAKKRAEVDKARPGESTGKSKSKVTEISESDSSKQVDDWNPSTSAQQPHYLK